MNCTQTQNATWKSKSVATRSATPTKIYASQPLVRDYCVANAFMVFDKEYSDNQDFMTGWRMWSFRATKNGNASIAAIHFSNQLLMRGLLAEGRKRNARARIELNEFRSGLMEAFPVKNRTMHFNDQYRQIFKKVAFVVVDCCFAVKFKLDIPTMRGLLTKMFAAAGGKEMPTHFVIVGNGIMDCEMDHKLANAHDVRYVDTTEGIVNYRTLNPSLRANGFCKMEAPFDMVHQAMVKSEQRARHKMSTGAMAKMNRNSINDFAQLFVMESLRRTFGMNARVALLSDDYGMIQKASTFKIHPDTPRHDGLPREFLDHYFITTNLLKRESFVEWKNQHAYPAFRE